MIAAVSHGPALPADSGLPSTLPEALATAAAQHPAHGVLCAGQARDLLTYPELLSRAAEVAGGLRAMGVAPGDPVLVEAAATRDFLTAFWGCVLAGALPAPVTGQIQQAAASALGNPLFLGTGGVDVARLTGPALAPHRPQPGDVALLQLSSGSTSGTPKIIPITHRGLHELAIGARAGLGISAASLLHNWLPLDHSGGFLLYHVTPVWLGASNIHTPTAWILEEPGRWPGLLAQEGVTHSWAPNFGYQLTAQAIGGRRWDLSRVESLASGGEQITLRAVEDFLAATAPSGLDPRVLISAWGMAETATGICFARLSDPGVLHRVRGESLAGELEPAAEDDPDQRVFFSVGRPSPGASFRITGDEGGVLPELHIGHLQVRSARITSGYWGDPVSTAAVFTADGWFDTGDLAFMSGGQITITGRSKDVIILNGGNHYCHEIEAAAGGGLVAAVGVPDQATGTEELVICHVPRAGETAEAAGQRIRAQVHDRLQLTVARVVAMTEAEFPRTSSGKIQRGKLRDWLLSESTLDSVPGGATTQLPAVAVEAAPAPPAGTTRLSASAARSLILAALGRPADPDTPFHELGLGSIQLIQLRAELSARLGWEVPQTAFFAYPTVSALAAHLSSGQPEGVAASGAGGEAEPADRRVAIIGMAARFPGAEDPEEFWAALLAGKDSVQRFAGLPEHLVPVTGALADIEGFDAGLFGIGEREAELLDPQHRLFLEVCHGALENGGYGVQPPGARIGLYAGSGMNLYTGQTHSRRLGEPGDPVTAIQAAIGSQPDFLPSRVAYRLGLTGPAVAVQTACSTSLVAVHLAVQALLSGDADLALAGAAAVHVPQVTGYEWAEGSMLSPTGEIRPFDAAADGVVGGNGVAAVLLKPYARALADGDTIHGVILGSAINNDGAAKAGFTAPSVGGQADVIRRALRTAGVSPGTIGYVEAHGTGTALGDPIEFAALTEVYERPPGGRIVLGSVKANIGHLDSCAGMAGLIRAVLSLREAAFAPQIKFASPNPQLDLAGSPFRIVTAAEPWPAGPGPRRAAVSALGVGGTNAHVILEEPPAVPARPEPLPLGIYPVSAMTAEGLAEVARRHAEYLRANPGLPAADLAVTAGAGRRHLPHRFVALGTSPAELATALEAGPSAPDIPRGPVAFTYSGQGLTPTDTAGLSRFPVWRATYERCLAAAGGSLGVQGGLVAQQIQLTELWRSWGVEPELAAGHSLGEYAALYAAGVLSLEDTMRLVSVRDQLFGEAMAPGAMLIVFAGPADTADVVAELGGAGLELAVVNTTAQHVLAGPAEAVGRAEAVLAGRGVATRRLAAERAFHTAMVEPALPGLLAAAAGVRFSPARIPVVGSSDGVVHPAGWVPAGDHLARHARQATRYDLTLDALAASGCRMFLEIGPAAVLTAVGLEHSPDGRLWVPSLRPGTPALDTLLGSVASLHTAGVALDWHALTSHSGGRRVPLAAYPYARDTQPEAAPAVLAGLLDGALSRVLGGPVTDPDASLLSLGADSLMLVNLAQEIERDYGVKVSLRELFGDLGTPARLAAAVQDRGTPRPAIPGQRTAPVVERLVPSADVQPVPKEDVQRAAPPVPVAADTSAIERIIQEQLRVMSQQLDVLRGTSEPATVSLPVPAPVPVPVREPVQGGLDFSLYFFGDYPAGDTTDAYQAVLSAAEYADVNGLHGVWLPERHFHSFGGIFPNPSVLASAVAARTSRIRINAGSVVLPLHHPIRVAEEWSVVDNLSGGRVGLGCAPGWHANDFVFFPENYGQHKDVMYDNLGTVLRLWRGEPVAARSGDGREIEVSLYPRPVQAVPPVFTAIVGNPDSYRQAAAERVGVVTNLMTQGIADLARNIALYRSEYPGGRVVVLVHTYLGPDAERARAEAFEPFCSYLRSSLSLLGQVANSLGMKIGAETAEDDIQFMLERAYERYCAERALIGSPESVAPVLAELTAAGADEIACFVDFGLPAAAVRAGLPYIVQLQDLVPAQAARHRQETVQPVQPGNNTEPASVIEAPIAPGQRRLWLSEQLDPGQPSYNEAVAIQLDGPLDVAALRAGLKALTVRHHPLRTGFRDGKQLIYPAWPGDLTVEDQDGEAEAAVRAAMAEESQRAFGLGAGEVFAARLLRFSPAQHVLVLSFHHLASDGWSYKVLTRDLSALYAAAVTGEPASLPELPVTYAELAARQADPSPASLAYWRGQLSPEPPRLRLPADGAGPGERPGRSLFADFPAELAEQAKEFSRAEGVTLFATLLAAFAASVCRFSGQDEFVLGTGAASRPAEAADLVGFFTATLPIRADLTGDPSLRTLARQLHNTFAEAFDYAVPFDELVRAVGPDRLPGRNPFFDVAIEFEGDGAFELELPGVTATLLRAGLDKAPLDLMVYLSHGAGGMRAHVEYTVDVLSEETVRGILGVFRQVLGRAVRHPDASLGQLLAEEGADPLAGPVSQAPEVTLGALCERWAADPGPAIQHGSQVWTHRELHGRATALASLVHAQGIAPGDLVAVCLPRGPELAAACLAVLRAGGAFLPLDPALPEARLRLMMADSGARLLLTHRGGLETKTPIVYVEDEAPEGYQLPPVPADPEALAYCVYTSGSSGTPKGVLVPHRAVVNTVHWHLGALLDGRPRVSQLLSPGFDAGICELFTTLASGGTLVISPEEVRADPAALAAWLTAEAIEVAFVPAVLAEPLFAEPVTLRVLITGGSALTARPPAGFPAVVVNEYGPTENGIVTTAGVVAPEPAAGLPHIGQPIPGVRLAILDPDGRAVPPGLPGELWAAGRGLALGYLGRPEETAAAFGTLDGEPAYRTGDRVRLRPDGSLDFLGRLDEQVQVRGYRVEPAEVTATLRATPGVQDAVVVPRGDRLVAYVVSTRSTAELRDHLAGLLPEPMIPSSWIGMPALPLTPNGKADLAALPVRAMLDEPAAEPATPAERRVHAAFTAELGTADVPADRSFFELGGHSLSAVRVANALGISPAALFQAPTVRRLAAVLDPVEDSAPATPQQAQMYHRARRAPASAASHIGLRINLTAQDGELDETALRSALDALVGRHPALRTRFIERDGQLRQEVGAPHPVGLSVVDDPADVDGWALGFGREPFALDEPYPFRAGLARLTGADRRRSWVLVLVIHHLVADGWSMLNLVSEFRELYSAALGGRVPALVPLPATYLDYARRELPDQSAYWRSTLDGLPPHEPVQTSGDGAEYAFSVPADLTRRLEKIAAAQGTTLFPVLVAAYAELICQLTGADDVLVAAPYAFRDTTGDEPVVGLYSSILPIRVRLAGVQTPGELIAQVRDTFHDAVGHAVPIGQVWSAVRPGWDPRTDPPPLASALIAVNPGLPALDLPGLRAELVDMALGSARRDWSMMLVPEGEGLAGVAEYATDVAGLTAIEERCAAFVAILEGYSRW
ncbi:hybrid non-ribosomal peptide synthetase/type I polyketide synthase [Longispora albida]|uniref:hybrid non-ribosomal peptide synthetase/type I polyketide synthase n=1 Tax=Longispora albida TaxID=203523 RepID=UPI00037B0E66|nr:hybrid non-ribosomal peptide synthetase/type I polyketide synthase [Longispora albida]